MNWIKKISSSTLFVIGFFTIYTNHIVAQSAQSFGQFDIFEMPKEIPGNYFKILPDSSCTSFLVTSESLKDAKTWAGKTMHVNSLDCNLKFQGTVDFKNTEITDSRDFSGVYFFHPRNNLLVTSLQIDKTSIKVNGEGIRSLQGEHQISDFKISGRTKAEIGEGVSSPDSSFFALIINVKTVDNKQSFICVFDVNLNEVYTYKFIHPLEMTETHFILNNKGEMMAFELLETEPEKRNKNKLTINFYSLKNNNIEKIYADNSMSDYFRTYLGTTANGNFNHYFIKSHEEEMRVKEKSGKMVTKTGEKYILYSVIFDSNFQKVFDVKNELKQSIVEKALQGTRDVFGIKLRGMFLQKNNTFIGVGDAGDDNISVTSKGVPIEVYNHNGILILNMDAEGKLLDVKVIERSEKSNWAPLVEVTAVEVHDGVFFSYFASKNESYLVKVVLDEAGALKVVKREINREMMGGRDLQQTSMVSDGDHLVYVDAGFAFKSFTVVRINTD